MPQTSQTPDPGCAFCGHPSHLAGECEMAVRRGIPLQCPCPISLPERARQREAEAERERPWSDCFECAGQRTIQVEWANVTDPNLLLLLVEPPSEGIAILHCPKCSAPEGYFDTGENLTADDRRTLGIEIQKALTAAEELVESCGEALMAEGYRESAAEDAAFVGVVFPPRPDLRERVLAGLRRYYRVETDEEKIGRIADLIVDELTAD